MDRTKEYTSVEFFCLFDQWYDVEDSATTYDLSRSTRQVKSMNKVVKKQLLAADNSLRHYFAEDKTKVKINTDPVLAAQNLRESSEGEELYILKAVIKGKKYSVISYYGGGNHTGYIFQWGSDKIFAEISDDDIVCAK